MVEATSLLGLIKPAIELAQPEWKKNQKALRSRFVETTTASIAQHSTNVARWCLEAHSLAHAGDEATAPTVELAFFSVPRRLGSAGGRLVEELDLLVSRRPTVVLGDPGAGKTTTLRRLAQHVTLEAEAAAGDDLRFVVLVVCREEQWNADGLRDVLRDRLGLAGPIWNELDRPEGRMWDVLNSGALVLVDGLDEVPAEHREVVERDLVRLGRHLDNSQLVVSCRSGDYVRLEGFDTAEIQPLSDAQIRDMAEAVLGGDEGPHFISQLDRPDHPAAELANRPLFLSQMMMIFRAQGTVPERPSDLYEAIVRLVIQEWDEHRRVRRTSRYGEFGPVDKRRFLSDIALELIKRDLITFAEDQLVAAYQTIAARYELPLGEARQVAQEIEGHTGLIVQSGTAYEFSHLSLQEFLAADSLLRAGSGARQFDWRFNPAVSAVAIALASNSTAWFIELSEQLPHDRSESRTIQSFLFRLAQERPRFDRDRQLGEALLELLYRSQLNDPSLGEALSLLPALQGSTLDALDHYRMQVRGDVVRLSQYQDDGAVPQRAIAVSTRLLSGLLGASAPMTLRS